MRTTLLVIASLAAPVAGQSIIHEYFTDGLNDYYAALAAFAGDTDGDGVTDFLVGQQGAQTVYLHDGSDGSVRLQLTKPSEHGFGRSFTSLDANGDGLSDLVVGSGSTFQAEIWLLSGLDGSVLGNWSGFSEHLLARLGDLDGDGIAEVAGAKHLYTQSFVPKVGAVGVYSSGTGLPLFSHFGAVEGDQIGTDVCGVGDVNGDGLDDYAYGIPGDDLLNLDAGAVRVHSGADGSEIWTVHGAGALRELGSALAAIGDLNLDGVPDIGVGTGPDGGGYALLISGVEGNTITGIYSFDLPYKFGADIAPAGDVTGDGHVDVVVAAVTNAFGMRVDLVDGVTAVTLKSVVLDVPVVGDHGRSLDAPADLNGDGLPEFIATTLDETDAMKTGHAWVVSISDLPWEHQGHALDGTAGKPILKGEGTLLVGEPVSLKIAQAKPSAAAWLIWSTTNLSAPCKGGVLVPDADAVVKLATDAAGKLTLSGPWPAIPGGYDLYLQAWILDGAGVEGWSATNALLAQVP